MKTFEHYLDSFKLDCEPENLDFCLKDQVFSIFTGPEILKTPGGKEFSHPSEELIKLLITVIQLQFVDRNGGYTRIIQTGVRQGDAAAMAILELVGYQEDLEKKSDH